MAGVAGALYVPQVGIINPSEFAPGNSIEAVIWVAVGGRGTLTGAVIGAVLVNYAKTYFTSGLLAPYWLFMLGGLFVAVTLLLPRGIVGTLHHWAALRRDRAIGGGRGRRRPSRSRRNEERRIVMEARTSSRSSISTASPSRSTASRRSTISRFAIEPGEMRAIIGPNGAGKTTMMDVVTGKTRPDIGDVMFDGVLRSHAARRGRDRRTRHRPQVPEADRVREPHRRGQSRTGAQVRPPRARAALWWRDDRAGARSIDEILDIDPARPRCATASAGSLSHGQKQWLEIGMLLAQEPKLLLVDEPVAGMTDAETQQTAELLKEINRERTVVVVEHDMAFVRELGVKVTCLHEGSVLAEGSDRSGFGERARRRSLSGTMARRHMLEVNAIDLHYGAAQALRGVSLKAEPGKVTCVLGRNGVGKTSLLDALAGQHPVTRGTITWEGKDITALRPPSAPGAASPMCRRAARSFRC